MRSAIFILALLGISIAAGGCDGDTASAGGTASKGAGGGDARGGADGGDGSVGGAGGSGNSVGCLQEPLGGFLYCVDITPKKGSKADAAEECSADGGDVLPFCGTTDLLGTCTLSSGEFLFERRYYTFGGYPPNSARLTCLNDRGTWTPA
jgi:hypothetical protein